jgi:mono/diheme cytochrome c family protein
MKPERRKLLNTSTVGTPRRTAALRQVAWFLCSMFMAALLMWQNDTAAAEPAESSGTASGAPALDDATCLACHGGTQALEVPDEDGELRPLLTIEKDRFIRGVHGDMACVDCHR